MISWASVIPHLPTALETVTKPQVDVGWTPSATMGAITNLILAAVGGGGLKIVANHFLQLRQIANQRASQVDSRADGYTDKLTDRVEKLETTLRDERLSFERQMTDERRECDRQLDGMRNELRGMQERLDGFMRQLISYQSSEARGALHLSPQMQRAVDSLDKITGTGEES